MDSPWIKTVAFLVACAQNSKTKIMTYKGGIFRTRPVYFLFGLGINFCTQKEISSLVDVFCACPDAVNDSSDYSVSRCEPCH